MTPAEKSKELLGKYKIFVLCQTRRGVYNARIEKENAKKCAKIAVKELINNSRMNYSGADVSDNEILSDNEYWQNVLKEIDLL